MAQDDSGLAQRGLLLLTMMTALVAVVLWIMFQKPGQALPAEAPAAAVPPTALVVPAAGYPAALNWPALAAAARDLPPARGWEVRYNAVGTLARLGSDHVPWGTLREMLDEKQQMRNYRVLLGEGKEVPDEVAARVAVLGALKALAEWHHKRRAANRPDAPPAALAVYAQVDELARSPYEELRAQAEKTRSTFFRAAATP